MSEYHFELPPHDVKLGAAINKMVGVSPGHKLGNQFMKDFIYRRHPERPLTRKFLAEWGRTHNFYHTGSYKPFTLTPRRSDILIGFVRALEWLYQCKIYDLSGFPYLQEDGDPNDTGE